MVIGITGSFGSGKTTVARMFGRLGAHVIDADKIYHSLTLPRKNLYKKIVRRFGDSILRGDGTINRKKLGSIVFWQRSKMRLLNKIAHPEIIARINEIVRARRGGIVIIDAAMLIESGFYKKMDRLVIVKTKSARQIERVIRAKGLARKEILRIIRMQAPLKKKVALADFIIDNSGSKKKTLIQVRGIWKQLGVDHASKRKIGH
ncbi:dephospho-CoA kinase [Patescibacteria group bacterium]|nr:dephospho-CoA kinase [Patescibacteria group bacterium]